MFGPNKGLRVLYDTNPFPCLVLMMPFIPICSVSTGPTCADYLWLDKKARICYVIVLCVIIGIIAPILISDYLGNYQADLGKCVVSGPYT